jgi:diguanylate cyclase (GGDEF)-like protein/PAS domain S-box-containing protein
LRERPACGVFFTKPLLQLTRKARQISDAGGYPVRIRQPQNDNSDIGALLRCFNAMLERFDKDNGINTEQKERLEATLNSIGAAVIVTDLEGRITWMNPMAVHLTGWTLEQTRGEVLEKVVTIVNALSGEAADSPVKTVFETGHMVALAHAVLVARDEKKYHVMGSAAPIKDKQEKLLGGTLVFHDVTGNRQAQAIIDAIHQGTSLVTGDRFFQELVRHLAELLQVRYAAIVKLLTSTEAVTVGFWADGRIIDDIEYSMVGTPCEKVVAQGTCLYRSGVRTEFPNDAFLHDHGIESYFGIPLCTDAEHTIGLLVIMDDKPLADVPMMQQVMEIFAARTGSELCRREAEKIKNGQQHILELIADQEKQLQDIFESVVQVTEDVYPSVRATILRLDHETLRHGAAPNMPAAYNKLVDGFKIGPQAGSCGTAAYLKQRVIVTDVVDDPRWSDFNHLGDEFGFKACWSEPILDARREVLGTFALYHRKSCAPGEQEIHFIETMAKLVAIAIQRKQSEQELQKLSRAVEASSAAVIITDKQDRIEYINARFTDITGYSRQEAVGQVLRSLLQAKETPGAVYDAIENSLATTGEWKGELYHRKKNGSRYWSRCSISEIKNDSGNISHYITILDDITLEYELTEQLSHQASHDSLTGLVNRYEFERRTEQLLARAGKDNTEHALCFMDLDQFKVINDTCGHTAGDEMLRQLSQALLQTLRKSDTLARLGGDEFGLLIECCAIESAQRVAGTIQKTIQDFQFSCQGHNFKIGVSIGLVAISTATSNLTDLLKAADAACYVAKEKGRNQIHVCHTQDLDVAHRHGQMRWITHLQGALQNNQFMLYLQSVAAVESNAVRHYEFLLRVKNRDGDIIRAGAFLPAAERYDLIIEIDRWVVTHALELLRNHPDFLENIHFCSINLSGSSLAQHGFLDFIIGQLVESGIDGGKICFEITETAAIANLNTATRFIATLKQKGCRFALDDFGSGLSSFSYLKNLKVDYLKIDGMFVRDIVDDPIDSAIVKAINEVGHMMGLKTIAEFVENDEIKAILQKIGVDYVQGSGIASPRPFSEVLEDLGKR